MVPRPTDELSVFICSSPSTLHPKLFQQRENNKRFDDLYTVMQRSGESLRDYVKRFNKLKVAIPNCLEETAVMAVRKGLRRGTTLYKKLTKYPCTSMAEVLVKAEAEIRLEVEDENTGQTDKAQTQHVPRIAPRIKDRFQLNSKRPESS